MEIVGPKGTLLYDPNEGLDANLFYQFMGLDHRVWAGDIVVDDVNTEFSE